MTGRNSSGKSNALDGLEVLSRLADGEDIADALDGRRREGGMVRGGSRGCVPHGASSFNLGCTVSCGDQEFRFDVTVQAEPDLRIVSESLTGPARTEKNRVRREAQIYSTQHALDDAPVINVEVFNGKRGSNPARAFRDSRLVLAQLPLALTGRTNAEKAVLHAASTVTLALRGIFHLDPVPHLMREFVPARDTDLRRTGENLSAALRSLQVRDPVAFHDVVYLTKKVADDRITDISFATSSLDDVMLQLEESRGEAQGYPDEKTPAREMSDGLLRFLGIATALKSSRDSLDIDVDDTAGAKQSDDVGGVLMVLEELENGLHPSQERRVLDLVRDSYEATGTRVLATTHSPALLDAAEGTLNQSIIVCHRDPDSGFSKLTRLTDLPGYARALAEGTLGAAVTAGKLIDDVIETPDYSEFRRFLGV
nr:ATP-binding protein [Corynebacterium kalidii]